MSKFVMSSRLAAELDCAFERNGWSAQEVKQLSSGKLLAGVHKMMFGQAEIKTTQHIIDCDVAPFEPHGFKVEEHMEGGQFKFKELLVQLFLTEDQKDGKDQQGHKVREDLAKELPDKLPLNANVLDYLLAHQEIIPEYWKGKNDSKVTYVVFWGTVYRELPSNNLYVRSLCWDGARWAWRHHRLDERFGFNCLAAMRIG